MSKRLGRRTTVLVAVVGAALVALTVLVVLRGTWELLLIAVIAVGAAVISAQWAVSGLQRPGRSLAPIASGLDKLRKAVDRIEDTVTSSPRMLDGSQERQIAETAARFDWIARQQAEILALLTDRAAATPPGPADPQEPSLPTEQGR